MAHDDQCLCGTEPLHPEKSVPVTGFSVELRQASDVERYWFSFALRGHVPLPVHLVYSASEGAAEIKAADLKVYRVEGVTSPCEARQRWIAWWKKTTRRPVFTGPRRSGRSPLVGRPAAAS